MTFKTNNYGKELVIRQARLYAPEKEGHQNSKKLAILLHGYNGGLQNIHHVAKALAQNVTVLVPKLPFANPLSLCSAVTIVRDLLAIVDLELRAGKYNKILIVGHSFGSVIARDLALQFPAETAGRKNSVERVVLLAGLLRGVRVSRHLGVVKAIGFSVGFAIASIANMLGLRLGVLDIQHGSPYLCGLRLRWLEVERRSKAPPVVQLLGTIDDLVSPRDNIDFATGSRFRYLEVKHTGHFNITEVGDECSTCAKHRKETNKKEVGFERPTHGKDRREMIKLAAFGSNAEIDSMAFEPWEMRPVAEEEIARREKVEQLLFVMHGIRDYGYWTDKIARRVVQLAKGFDKPGLVERVTPTYGYLGMGPFLLPWIRDKKVIWFVEQYILFRAMYGNKNLRFHYVGHSNGTYLLARALMKYPDIRFDKVVFAGSVVRRDFDWASLGGGSQRRVGHVLNIAATHDWVVGIFTQFFELLSLQDLGSAGHNGFDKADSSSEMPRSAQATRSVTNDFPRVQTIRFAGGGHAAGIKEGWWDKIAKFILSAEPVIESEQRRSNILHWVVEGLSQMSPMIVLMLIAVVGVLVPATVFFIVGSGTWYWLSAFDYVGPTIPLILAATAGAILTSSRLRMDSKNSKIEPLKWCVLVIIFGIGMWAYSTSEPEAMGNLISAARAAFIALTTTGFAVGAGFAISRISNSPVRRILTYIACIAGLSVFSLVLGDWLVALSDAGVRHPAIAGAATAFYFVLVLSILRRI